MTLASLLVSGLTSHAEGTSGPDAADTDAIPKAAADTVHETFSITYTIEVTPAEPAHARVRWALAGIDEIGQAFADEIFRVYSNEHPEVRIVPANAGPEVKKRIRRAKAGNAVLPFNRLGFAPAAYRAAWARLDALPQVPTMADRLLDLRPILGTDGRRAPSTTLPSAAAGAAAAP